MPQLDFLKKIEIFSQLSPEQLGKIQELVCEEVFPEGAVIFQENSLGDKIYVIQTGSVEIGKGQGVPGKPAKLARLESGEVLGELAIFDEKPRSAAALAAGPGETVLLGIRKADLDRLMEQEEALANKVLRGVLRKVSHRLRRADEAIQSLLSVLRSQW